MPVDSQQIKQVLAGLNKFQLVREINEGMNAFAFSARHIHLDRPVFLKIIFLGREEQESILAEPQLLVRALSANPPCDYIVQLYDAETLDIGGENYLCLQMEYVDGRSLLSTLQFRPFGQQEAVRISTNILHGVNHLHAQRMVHRDLKPANILLAGNIPKITDFGSVRMFEESQDFVAASKHSALYVPPEGWESPSRYFFFSDVYQVGMILYELVNGCLVYDQEHYVTPALRRNLQTTGRNYRDLDDFQKTEWSNRGIAILSNRNKLLEYGCSPKPYYSYRLRRIINCATTSNLARRFQTVDEVLHKLLQIDVPNWKPVDDRYEAASWRGFDWRVCRVRRARQNQILVERAREGATNYRAIRKQSFDSHKGAFAFIEAIE